MSYLLTWMQNNRVTKGIYKTAKAIANIGSFSIEDINVIESVKSENKNQRLNIILPTVNKYKIFGGIATALNFFDLLGEEMNADMRIIVNRKEKFNKNYSLQREGYSYNTQKGKKRVVFLSDTNNVLSVREKDIFLCTSWDTAYCINRVVKWKEQVYGNREKIVYLIQDFEPGFYPWSTQYLLADSTYRNKDIDILALFNSKYLYDFFIERNYSFYKMLYFEPVLNKKIAKYLIENSSKCKKKKRILIYGRPGSARNAFTLIEYALKLWSLSYRDAADWEIISLGETFDDIKLTEHNSIKCLGKASLEKYSQIMLESYVGISLMVSPHPSYPPLEMSTFGVKTITNCFENKDLSSFSENIISLEYCTPEEISSLLCNICAKYPEKICNIITSGTYINGNDQMKQAARKILDFLGDD